MLPIRSGFLKMWALVVLLTLAVASSACSTRVTPSTTPTLEPSALPKLPFSAEFSLTEIPVDEAMSRFQDPISQEIFAGIQHFTKTGIQSLHTVARFGPTEDALTSGPSIVLKPGEGLIGYILLVNTLDYPHDFRIVPALDYYQMPIRFNGRIEAFPGFHMEPKSQRAFRFSLSPLPRGLHVVTLTFLVDPDHYFAFNPATFDPRENEAMGLHDAPFEFGLLIWVTKSSPETVQDWPRQAWAIPPEKATLFMNTTLVKEKPPPGQPGLMFQNKDTVCAGEKLTYYALFVAPDAKTDIPVKVLVFWDKQLTQVSDLQIPPEAAYGTRYIPFEIQVPDNLSEGKHFLTAIAYPYPYYLRAWIKDDYHWSSPVGFYSYPMARLPVVVKSCP